MPEMSDNEKHKLQLEKYKLEKLKLENEEIKKRINQNFFKSQSFLKILISIIIGAPILVFYINTIIVPKHELDRAKLEYEKLDIEKEKYSIEIDNLSKLNEIYFERNKNQLLINEINRAKDSIILLGRKVNNEIIYNFKLKDSIQLKEKALNTYRHYINNQLDSTSRVIYIEDSLNQVQRLETKILLDSIRVGVTYIFKIIELDDEFQKAREVIDKTLNDSDSIRERIINNEEVAPLIQSLIKSNEDIIVNDTFKHVDEFVKGHLQTYKECLDIFLTADEIKVKKKYLLDSSHKVKKEIEDILLETENSFLTSYVANMQAISIYKKLEMRKIVNDIENLHILQNSSKK